MAEKLDLNRVTVANLEKFPGITRAVARRIVATRDKQGGFATVGALREITGVTPEIFSVLKENLTVNRAAAEDQTLVARIDLDPQRQHAGGYAGYKVTAELVALTVLPGTVEQVTVPRAITNDSSVDGLATLTLPALVTIQGRVTFIVRAPDGEIMARVERDKSELREAMSIAVVPRGLPTTQPADDLTFNQPTKLRGRVIDRAGRIQISGKQVVIWTATTANPQDADFAAVMVAETDATGYLSGPYPLGKFTSAHATVALEPIQAVPIRLNDGGTMPANVILVVDAPRRMVDQQNEDCDCHSPATATPRNPDANDLVNGNFSSDLGQGRCVDFTRPDRTLQEFSYSYVVRTTEPAIKGLTLSEPTRIPPSVLGEIVNLSNLSLLSARGELIANDNNADTQALALRSTQLTNAAAATNALELHADVWRKAVSNPEKASPSSLLQVAKTSKYLDIIRAIDKSLVVAPDRTRLSCRNPVDWDDDPTIYQACTVAHGHVLHFKQEWIADGYSMGRLLYSLPLAPGQKKQIAVLDWERRESAIRQESLVEEESLQATLSRDRDIGEMVNSVLTESSRGGSSASTSAFGGGLGIGAIIGPVGGLLGIGGGASNANSTAWQNSSRNVSANSLQTLRDRTSQAAASMRAQRSTVIQTVSQGERVAVTTESVANYNHCHAMTMEYFEILRHLIVRQRLIDVQECLFVPLQMSRFDRAKALRWRHTLQGVVPTRDLRIGFDALERIDNNYEGSDMPLGAYADERLDYVEGELTVRFQLARPRDKDDDFDPPQWQWMGILLPMISAQEAYRNFLKDQKLKDRIFLEQFGPRIAAALVDLMRFSWVDSADVEHPLPIDTTLLSNFTNDTRLAVSLRLSGAVPPVARKDIKFIKITASLGIPFISVLPAQSRVIVEGGQMSYRTKFSSGYLFQSGRVANDLTGTDEVRIFTPLTLQELRKPREEDKELARRLLDHLNENIERYHHALWWRMSPDRRYMLLDGFEAPNSGGRSVASVVDNTLIGIAGNSLIMPVSRGFHLDPTFNQDVERPVDLLEHYQPNTPIEPVSVAIPSRGVYAESVMGACNSCEVKEEERFWRWEESPIPDNPPAILPTSTDTRRAEPPNLEAKDFPSPIIAMQSAPAAPDPTGLAGALNLLGQSGLFKDITGLEGNQRNALEALKSSLQTAQFFGEKAGNLALQARMNKDIDKTMRAIDSAKQQGLLTDDQAKQLTQGAIQSMMGAGPSTEPKAMGTEDVKQVTDTAGANSAAVKVTRPSGEQVEVDARPQTLPDGTAPRKPSITLAADTASAETRAFNPSTNSLSGEVSLEVQVNDAPAGFTVKWTPADAAALDVVTPNAQTTIVRGKRPGLTRLDVAVFNGGSQIAQTQMKICVPQFVTVDEDAALFTPVLAQLKIDTRKADVLTEARNTCRELLKTANVRTVWRMAPFSEAVTAHVTAAFISTVRIQGEPPNDAGGQPIPIFGRTTLPAGAGTFNEQTVLFPGAYDVSQPASPTTPFTMVDAETQALLLEVQATPTPSAALLDLAVKVFGRLIGETMAHEIMHGLLGVSVGNLGADGHNAPPVPGELLNDWLNRSFRQRTGIEDTALVSPVDPANFIDHGIATIGKIGANNQTLINARFPVPPSFT